MSKVLDENGLAYYHGKIDRRISAIESDVSVAATKLRTLINGEENNSSI